MKRMDVKMKKLFVEELVIERIMDTTFEDGSCWIEYRIGEKLGYELTTDLQEGDEEMLQSWIDDKKFNASPMIEKKDITECSDYLAEIIERARMSENEVWCVDEGTLPEEFVEEIEEETIRLGIHDYFLFHEEECDIYVLGGAITQFLF